MGKISKLFIIIAAVAALAAAGCVVYNIFATQRQSDTLNSYIDKQEERYAEELKKEDEFIEDGAVIGEQYTIRSTKQISDAYLAGDPSNLSDQDKETYDLAVEVLDRETKGCSNVYEKEKKIFEWMCKNIKHDAGNSTRALRGSENYPLDTPWGVLNGKYAVCVGYATTFRLLMNMLGCDCHIPHNEGHSWDEVQLDDGEWYFVDIYSASGNGVDYQYFNMDELVAADLTDNSCYSHLPAAKGHKYLYPVQVGKPIKDIYEIPKRVKEGYDKKENCISMIFEKNPTEDESNLANNIVNAISSHIDQQNTSGNGYTTVTYCWYRDENDKLIMAVYITESNYEEEIDTSSPEAKKIKKLLDKYFGEATDVFTPGEEGSMMGDPPGSEDVAA